ncbi:Adenylate kinase isoenzyme 6 [Amphibalanus amphitrite]|uniref:Adenylate kinase isoenzyme 6 homolog n=2 Tax=Amphibalanus amphitrite TaxID=1232801 RepID=A0A6A4VXC2_AMPAM|nr:adenylate kinase isoenzyme 6-like [Amphibalanus amphitrite]XP_043204234.1 adenylate kinase isoenzyme 6-like [Amphibalanus amphitrite]XP_043204245.1 adenylate kinase isoenzyme 6-like [Amphibalanus amphitrite]XP_043204256.1 adenylate kinase isoenzyme 6-like [Amphibalanus amphitrite]XP_043235207.1 adenylate kinase isoenzyme 6-like isoform X2 [Amphibalanus amphitrite]XP_043235208.1 adenylate kinase isoenzyme 6-like isoform X2 [Amphibalanus amphitrite]XP_043235209.1 adenylate kinase isoenzyme 6
MSENRTLPNILVTGTPGVGKSTTCEQLSEATGLRWLNVSEIARETDCLDEFDPQYGCPVLNEDKLLDELEPRLATGGNIVEYHGCDFFPERWFDIVFVLRTDNKLLYDRLTKRGYSGKKLEENVQCEIFQTLLDEARGAYSNEIVHELPSNTPDQMEENVERICQWVSAWKVDHGVA